MGDRPATWVLAAALLGAALLAGCLGGEPTAPSSTQDPTTDEPTNASREDEPDASAERPRTANATTSFEGFGIVGAGARPANASAWIAGANVTATVDVPGTVLGGQLAFTWEGDASIGGLAVRLLDADGQLVHAFRAEEPELEVELEPGDERVLGAREVEVEPAEADPATVHPSVAWEGTLRVEAPAPR
jgi:hypothetical protein